MFHHLYVAAFEEFQGLFGVHHPLRGIDKISGAIVGEVGKTGFAGNGLRPSEIGRENSFLFISQAPNSGPAS
jgi:hypothetical protein